MKRFALLLAALLVAPFAAAAPPDAPKLAFKTGAKPTPKAVIAASPRFQKSGKIGAPLQFAAVPTRLSMWGNDQYGDCVTAEECAAKIADHPHAFITEETCIRWAAQHGVLNGADLKSVLDMMARDGIMAEDGTVYKDGPAAVVDFNDKAALEAAIYQGRVKIAVAHAQIEDAVNRTRGRNGWAGVNWGRDREIDHCVGLFGYGPASFLYERLGVPLPAGMDGNTYGYLMFTWNSIGFVDRPSLMNVTAEAWVRNPTTAGYPKPPEPQPKPPAPPQPEPQPEPPAPTPTPDHTVPVWVFALGAGVVVVVIGGIVFVGRKSAAK